MKTLALPIIFSFVILLLSQPVFSGNSNNINYLNPDPTVLTEEKEGAKTEEEDQESDTEPDCD